MSLLSLLPHLYFHGNQSELDASNVWPPLGIKNQSSKDMNKKEKKKNQSQGKTIAQNPWLRLNVIFLLNFWITTLYFKNVLNFGSKENLFEFIDFKR